MIKSSLPDFPWSYFWHLNVVDILQMKKNFEDEGSIFFFDIEKVVGISIWAESILCWIGIKNFHSNVLVYTRTYFVSYSKKLTFNSDVFLPFFTRFFLRLSVPKLHTQSSKLHLNMKLGGTRIIAVCLHWWPNMQNMSTKSEKSHQKPSIWSTHRRHFSISFKTLLRVLW